MNELAPREAPLIPSETVAALAERIAREAPGLEDLGPEQLEHLARAVIIGNLTEDLRKRAALARVDYQAEREAFIAQAGRVESEATRRAYLSALDRLEEWSRKTGIPVLEMKPRNADDFAYWLKAEADRAPASIRRDLAAASSFFSFLERRFDEIRNPFRGSKARPALRRVRPCEYPEKLEVLAIMAGLDPVDRAAVAIMALRGLRVGALPGLEIRAGRFSTRSKGKDQAGEIPPEVLAEIAAAGLDARRPFEGETAQRLADRFRRKARSLAGSGIIRAPYSVHDLRHFYAVTEYRKTPDLYRLKTLLGHASVSVTETYLHGLEVL